MADLLKDKYNNTSVRKLALCVKDIYPSFEVERFVNDTIDNTWQELSLKARMRRITLNLGKYLPSDYEEALSVIDAVIKNLPSDLNDFTLMYFPDFVEIFGQDERHWDLSMAALERYTSSSSAEFAVRPFIINYEERMMAQMAVWAKHDSAHVRRLASEGCRPSLPWGQALTSFKKDPTPILGILEELKKDPSLYVRKSVANNLNDISKTHPELVAGIARDWYGENEHTDWIIKHACRTLLKNGNRDVLSIFGFLDSRHVTVNDFKLDSTTITIGDRITFSFDIEAEKETKIRMEYAVYYVKANGKRNRKIFQISEISLKENEKKHYIKRHSFADMSTRKHYSGLHAVTLIVNGVEHGTLDFDVRSEQSVQTETLNDSI